MAGTLMAQEVFSFLLPEQVNAISDAAERVSCKAGDFVYRKGDKAEYFFVVLEGQITLLLPNPSGLNIVIDQVGRGSVFGGPLGQRRKAYRLSAQCSADASLLKITVAALNRLMDRDMRLGLHLQRHVANAYFDRYIDTMQKLQAIVMNIPMEA